MIVAAIQVFVRLFLIYLIDIIYYLLDSYYLFGSYYYLLVFNYWQDSVDNFSIDMSNAKDINGENISIGVVEVTTSIEF